MRIIDDLLGAASAKRLRAIKAAIGLCQSHQVNSFRLVYTISPPHDGPK